MAFPTFTSRRARGTALVAAVGFALALSACSPAGSEPSEPASDASEAQVAPPVIMTEDTLTVCTGDSAPNIYYDENNELQGVEIGLAKALAEQLGLTVAFEEYAFAGLIPGLQAKHCDVIMGSLYIKPEREEIVNFVPYLYSGTGVGVNKENPKDVTGFNDSLCGVNVVAVTGATGGTSAAELSEECVSDGKDALEITLVDEGTSAVQQVIAGQADAFVDTSEIMSFYEGESGGSFMMIGEPVGKIRIGAATLKDNAELNAALDKGFQALVDDGTYLSILEEWGVEANDITKPQ